jgi:MYXO-CTERM domain-containing protein
MAVGLALVARRASAVDADPSSYEQLLGTLGPGDTLALAPGTYGGNLDLVGLNGTEAAPIVIQGPADKSAVFTGNACCNTVEITGSSYLVIRNLTVDAQGLDGVFGLSAKGGDANVVHHITVEDCDFVGHGASQQTVAISTKAPTWGWVVRRNRIVGAGTGMYFGNSDGSAPFVAGLIENNLVRDTIGYNVQIKFQQPWPPNAGLPAGKTSTIIRNNVFIKNDAPSPDGDRPNLLVGGFPASGPGADNLYEIYGNFFFHNPREAHLQASGRVSIHDNVLVDAVDAAVVLTDHDLALRRAHVYNNTVYAAARGIVFGSSASEGDFVVGNLIFAPEGVSGPAQSQKDNLLFALADAPTVVASPSLVLGQMDFYPKAGQAQGAPLDLGAVAGESDHDRDFNGTPKGDLRFRGAYAGEGDNPGWQLDADLKQGGGTASGATSGAGGASATGAGPAGATSGAGGGPAGPGAEADDEAGCGCRHAGAASEARWLLVALLLAAALGRQLRRRARASRTARAPASTSSSAASATASSAAASSGSAVAVAATRRRRRSSASAGASATAAAARASGSAAVSSTTRQSRSRSSAAVRWVAATARRRSSRTQSP